MTTRTQILAHGIVQGVGFRPFIFSLANKGSLKGEGGRESAEVNF
jgi:hydrogenase maturation factor HypF (carbamoyltransferase family)